MDEITSGTRRAAENSIPRGLLFEVKEKEKIKASFDRKARQWSWEIPKPWYADLVLPGDEDEDEDGDTE